MADLCMNSTKSPIPLSADDDERYHALFSCVCIIFLIILTILCWIFEESCRTDMSTRDSDGVIPVVTRNSGKKDECQFAPDHAEEPCMNAPVHVFIPERTETTLEQFYVSESGTSSCGRVNISVSDCRTTPSSLLGLSSPGTPQSTGSIIEYLNESSADFRQYLSPRYPYDH